MLLSFLSFLLFFLRGTERPNTVLLFVRSWRQPNSTSGCVSVAAFTTSRSLGEGGAARLPTTHLSCISSIYKRRNGIGGCWERGLYHYVC
uniref:Putative secreted protein n=1 Tax=Anopheles darlingi TaxID=43151 RepID=A0A2M4DEY2_ANODA